MARDIASRTNVDPVSATNPFGAIRDESAPAADDGTPVNEAVNGDHLVFFQQLMDRAGITPNETADNNLNGFQLMDALITIINQKSGGGTAGFTQLTTGAFDPASDLNWGGIAYNGAGRWCAVNDTSAGHAGISDDNCLTWTAQTIPQDNPWKAIAFGAGVFCAVASSGTNRVATSTDGITWILRTAAEANSWNDIIFAGGQFVACSSDGTNRVITSPDGITWTARSAPAFEYDHIEHGNGVYGIIGNGPGAVDGVVSTSSDAISWTQRTLPDPMSDSTRGIATNGLGTWVATSNVGDPDDFAVSIDDGATWVAAQSGQNAGWSPVVFGTGKFYAFAGALSGGFNIASSINGSTWELGAIDVSVAADAIFENGIFVMIGFGQIAIRGF